MDALKIDVLKTQGVEQRFGRGILALAIDPALVREEGHLARAAFDRLDEAGG